MRNRSSFKRESVVLILTALFYLLLWISLPKPSFWVLDNGIKFQGARSLVETGELCIDYDGSDFDPAGNFRPLPHPFSIMKDGRQIPAFSALFMLLSAILIKIFGNSGSFLLSLLGGYGVLLACWLLWSRTRPDHDGRVYLVLIGLATPLLFYSLSLWEHSLATALVIFSIALLIPRNDIEAEEQSRWFVFVSGIILGFSAGFRTETIILIVLFPAFWKFTGRTLRNLMEFIIGVLVGLAGIGLINLWLTGDVRPLHLLTNAAYPWDVGISGFIRRTIDSGYGLLFSGFRSKLLSLGLVSVMIVAGIWIKWRKNWLLSLILGIAVLAVWLTWVIVSMGVSNRISYTINSGGLFWVMPLIILCLLPLKSTRFSKYKRLIWLVSVFYLLSVILLAPITRGIHWGPRLLLPIIPLLVFLSVARAQQWWGKYRPARWLIVALASISILGQLYSFSLLYQARSRSESLNRWITTLPTEENIQSWAFVSSRDASLTNMWWLPGDVALHSDRTPWYLTDTPDGLNYVINSLRKRGELRFIFYEQPPYVPKDIWWRLGVEVKGQDYFLGDDARLRRNWMRIYK